ncbi:MAG: hypothetical protein ABSG52_14480 [Terriglobales bacterium]|jgi:hypothetical protein
MVTADFDFTPDEWEALRQLARERAEANRLAAAAAAREQEARKVDREKALAKLTEDERLNRHRQELWRKNP